MPELPTPFSELNAVLRDLTASTRAALGETFLGAYLQGSFALGDFDAHSDCDFIVAIRDELTAGQIGALRSMHERIFDSGDEWARHLEGSYFPWATLRDYRRCGTPLWYIDNGSRVLEQSDHDNTIVVRWVLRDRGVVLAGPAPATLVDPIPVAAFRQEMRDVAESWGRQILADRAQIGNRFYQTFAVLFYCRILHDLHRGVPGSKRAAARWAKAMLDPRWHDLIDRAWLGRPDPARSVREPADPADVARTAEFVDYVLERVLKYEAASDVEAV